jgi:NTE family protein
MRLAFRPPAKPPLSLALQGGGAHGAWTWGVLDALLERGVELAAVSGASAGAMNAIALAQGLCVGGPEGARAALEALWHAVAECMPPLWHLPGDPPRLAPMSQVMLHWSHWLSPAQLNPLDLNPLRELLLAQIDFERLRATPGPALFIAATDVGSGRLRLLRRHELSADGVLASACLPAMAHAVMIDGRAHWDGAFSANPALFPLVREVDADDVLIVTLSVLGQSGLPSTASEIAARVLDIAFHAAFQREAQWLGELHADARSRIWPRSGIERRLARLRWHLIDAGPALAALPAETRLVPAWDFLCRLRDEGREATRVWWERGALGRHSSVDLAQAFQPPPRPRPA